MVGQVLVVMLTGTGWDLGVLVIWGNKLKVESSKIC